MRRVAGVRPTRPSPRSPSSTRRVSVRTRQLRFFVRRKRAQAQRVSQEQATLPLGTRRAGRADPVVAARRRQWLSRASRRGPRTSQRCASMPGVRSVGRVELHTVDNIESVPWIGAPAVWSKIGRGEHVQHRHHRHRHRLHARRLRRQRQSLPSTTRNNPNVIEPGTFPTAKVKGGFDFAGADLRRERSELPCLSPMPDPLDGQRPRLARRGYCCRHRRARQRRPGCRTRRRLYALKVFSDEGGSTDVTSLAIEWAMDPNDDGDMSDHLDVINMSLGSPFGNPHDPSAISTQQCRRGRASSSSTSAGNEGTTSRTSPARQAWPAAAISTAATTPGGNHLSSRFTVTAPRAARRREAFDRRRRPGDAGIRPGPITALARASRAAHWLRAIDERSSRRAATSLCVHPPACVRLPRQIHPGCSSRRESDHRLQRRAPMRPHRPMSWSRRLPSTIPGVMIPQADGIATRRCRQRQRDRSTWPWIPPDATIRSPPSPRAAPATAARRSSRISSAPGVSIVSAGVGHGHRQR